MADAIILQGHLTQSQFDANPTFVLGDGQIAWLKDNSGKFKKGDGITVLSALPFLGISDLTTVLGVGNEMLNTQSVISEDGLTSLKVIDDLGELKTSTSGITVESSNGATIYNDSGVVGEFAKVQSFEGANILQADVLNRFDAPDNNFPQETASKIAVFDASKNLKSGTVNESDLEVKSNKGTVLGNLTSTTIYSHAKAVVDYVASLGYITISALTGYIKGSVSATAGLIPFGTGTADTVTSSSNFSYISDNVQVTGNVNAPVTMTTRNNSTGNGAGTGFNAVNNAGKIAQFFKAGTGYSTYKTIKASDCGFYTDSGDFSFLNDFASGNIQFTAGGASIAHLIVKSNGNIGHAKNSFFGDTTTTSTAYVDIKGGTSSLASFRLRQGVPTTTPLTGEMYQDGTDCYMYLAGVWKKLNV